MSWYEVLKRWERVESVSARFILQEHLKDIRYLEVSLSVRLDYEKYNELNWSCDMYNATLWTSTERQVRQVERLR